MSVRYNHLPRYKPIAQLVDNTAALHVFLARASRSRAFSEKAWLRDANDYVLHVRARPPLPKKWCGHGRTGRTASDGLARPHKLNY